MTAWAEEGSAKSVKKSLLNLACHPSLPKHISNKLKLIFLKKVSVAVGGCISHSNSRRKKEWNISARMILVDFTS